MTHRKTTRFIITIINHFTVQNYIHLTFVLLFCSQFGHRNANGVTYDNQLAYCYNCSAITTANCSVFSERSFLPTVSNTAATAAITDRSVECAEHLYFCLRSCLSHPLCVATSNGTHKSLTAALERVSLLKCVSHFMLLSYHWTCPHATFVLWAVDSESK